MRFEAVADSVRVAASNVLLVEEAMKELGWERAELETLLQDLKRAQAHLGTAASSVGVAARAAERTPLGNMFIDPVKQAEATLNAVWWQLEGHKALVEAELARLPPRTAEDAPRNARHG